VSVSVSLHRQAKVDRAVVLVASCVVAADNAGGRFVQGSLRRAVRRLLPLALTFVSLVQPSALASGWHAISRRRETIDRGSPCLGRRPLFGSYGWPVKPFDRPHPVRGNFGDPRTSFIGDLRGGPGAPGVFVFHNGVDISAPDGTAVYPVTGGRVIDVEPDNITIAADDDRHFQYWHIKPNVVTGEAVTPDRTILGRILPRLGHVHLTEIDRGRVVNPLLPGHLFPYEDSKPPRVERVIVTGERGRDALRAHRRRLDHDQRRRPRRSLDRAAGPLAVGDRLARDAQLVAHGPGRIGRARAGNRIRRTPHASAAAEVLGGLFGGDVSELSG
jgi:hypothetical protein